MALDHVEYLLDVERLTDVADGSAGLDGESNSVAQSCCDEDDRRVTATVAIGEAERGASQSWHGDIEQDEVDLTLQCELKCILAIGGFHDAVAFIFEQHRQDVTDIRTVLGDEDDRPDSRRKAVLGAA